MDNFSLPLPHGFSLRDTLLCGQCFRWEENAGGSFTGWAGAHHATLYQQGDTLLVTGSDPDFWEEYLDLREDYDGWKTTFSADRTLSAAIEKCGGIRILRQQPWETVISFIISANNNIPRIRGIIDRLCSVLERTVISPLRSSSQYRPLKHWRLFAQASVPNTYWTLLRKWQMER